MVTIPLRTHLESNGTLNLSVPTGLPESDVEVVVIVHPVPDRANGWPEHFFEDTYGAFADHPIVRPDQQELEVRKALR